MKTKIISALKIAILSIVLFGCNSNNKNRSYSAKINQIDSTNNNKSSNEEFRETIIDTINSEVFIAKIDYNVKCTSIEGTTKYKGKTIMVYNSGFDGYYMDYDLTSNIEIPRIVEIVKQEENNKIKIIGRASFKDLVQLGE